MKTQMYNFRTQKWENVENPESWADYIPQDEAAQMVYKLSVALGETPEAAAILVLQSTLNSYLQDTDTGK